MDETFDTAFDYSDITERISSSVTICENRLDAVNSEIVELETAVDYESLVAHKLTQLNKLKTVFEQRLVEINTINDKLTNLLALSESDKAKLHNYFKVLMMTVEKSDYMKKLINNYQNVLDSADVDQLINDTETTMETKCKICCIVYYKLMNNDDGLLYV